MNLDFIEEKECPICGCKLIIEEKIEKENYSSEIKYRQHCNGGRWETRKFGCGQELKYCPNFSETELSDYAVCKNNESYKMKKDKREKALAEFKDYINTLDVDNDYKNKLLFNCPSYI